MCGALRSSLFGLFFLIIGPVILVTPSKTSNCGEISADDCLEKLKTFLHITSLPFTSDKSELVRLCDATIGGYNCSRILSTPNCLSTQQKNLFSAFIEMAEITALMFCDMNPDREPYLRNALLENSECILKQREAIDCCATQSKVPDFPIMYIMDQSGKSHADKQITACCPVTSYLKCAKTVVDSKCGEAAGNLTYEYIRRSAGEGVQVMCQSMHNYPDPGPEVCRAPAPVCAGCRTESFIQLILLMGLLFLTWNSYH